MSKVFLTLILLLITGLLHISAQKGYEPGYVITKSFDTLPGLVKDRKEAPFAKIYDKIRFRGNGLFTKKYSPKKIKGYARGEDLFESHWIEVSSRFLRTQYLNRENLGEQHFLKVRQKGFLSYYQWEWLDQDSFIVDEMELFIRRDEDYFIRVTQGLFGLRKNALEKYFEDCPELMEKIHNKELRLPAEIAGFYNDWLDVK
jgi:hypothetical protein